MRPLIATGAFLAGLAALLIVAGGGLVLLLVPDSGERLAGALLAVVGSVSFGSLLLLIFGRADHFQGGAGRAVAAIATLVAVIPVLCLAGGAFVFAGLPAGSLMPGLDWTVFAAGIGFGLGALSILAVGYMRTLEVGGRKPVAPQPDRRPARHQLRDAFEHRAAAIRLDRDGDARVTRV